MFPIFISFLVTGIPIVGNCPTSMTINIDEDETSAVVSWIPPFATDPDVPVVRTSNYEPMDIFPIGETTVTYTFVDNTNLGASCVFQVTVAGKFI